MGKASPQCFISSKLGGAKSGFKEAGYILMKRNTLLLTILIIFLAVLIIDQLNQFIIILLIMPVC
jgi:hypothetical protein